MTELTMSESISVAVPPETLYALVSDVTRMGDWNGIPATLAAIRKAAESG